MKNIILLLTIILFSGTAYSQYSQDGVHYILKGTNGNNANGALIRTGGVTTSGTGGDLTLTSGGGAGTGGNIFIVSGSSAAKSGDITIKAADSYTKGGDIIMSPGTSFDNVQPSFIRMNLGINKSFQIYNNSTLAVNISNTGDLSTTGKLLSTQLGVGLGTTAPASNAHFVFNQSATGFGTTAQYLVLSNSNTTQGNNSGIAFSSNTGGVGTSFITAKHNRDAVNSGRLTFHTRNLNGDIAEGLTLTENSNIGLGIASPLDKLHLYKPTGMIRQIIETDDHSTAGIHIQHSTHASTIGFMENSNVLKINNTGSFSDNHVVINESGKVGVGLINPESKLEVFQTGTIGNLWDPSKAYLKLSDGSSSLIFDSNEIYSNSSLAIGSADAEDILFRNVSTTGSTDLMVVKASGDVGIGTSSPNAKLSVNGMVTAKEVEVLASGWPDYVFEENYVLPTLYDVEEHIKEKKHLPGIPSAKEVETNGLKLGEMDALLLQKIEELTLYMIEQEKLNREQAERLKNLEEENKRLSLKIGGMEK